MIPATQRDLATEIARCVVAEVANTELADFDATAEEYWHDPRRVRDAYRDGDELLAFGDLASTLLTPAALYIAAEVVKFLFEAVKGSLGELLGDFFKDLVGPGRKNIATAPQFTSEQVEQAYTLGRRAAKELGLPKAKSDLLVGAVIVQLQRMSAQDHHAQVKV
jgi:hypothetical protein